MATAAQLTANRANAQSSTGPPDPLRQIRLLPQRHHSWPVFQRHHRPPRPGSPLPGVPHQPPERVEPRRPPSNRTSSSNSSTPPGPSAAAEPPKPPSNSTPSTPTSTSSPNPAPNSASATLTSTPAAPNAPTTAPSTNSAASSQSASTAAASSSPPPTAPPRPHEPTNSPLVETRAMQSDLITYYRLTSEARIEQMAELDISDLTATRAAFYAGHQFGQSNPTPSAIPTHS